jgi:hypothetical protein
MTESLDQAAEEWRAYIDPLAGIAGRLLPQIPNSQDPQLRRELYRSIFAQISSGYFALLCADPQHPDFWPYLCSAYNWGAINPDDDYYASPLDDTGVYRISGFRGTVKRIDFQIGTGSLIPRGVLDEQIVGLTLANYDLDSVTHAQDGAFEVILSPERPAGYTGDWWHLHKGTTYTMVRQIFYDWVNEVSGRLAIERLDRAAVKPRPSAAELEKNLKDIARWTEDTIRLSIMFAAAIRQQQGINQLGYKDLTQYGEIVTQKYVYGGFELAQGEALIVEFKIPEICRYWSIHLTDDLAYVLDWIHRQTILNGHTAKVDRDGIFRGVIAAGDPGVHNWLDTMGYATGIIQVRWEECSEWPDHKVTKVKLSEVRSLLPADTPVVTPEERDATIRRRRTAAQLRKRW